MFQPSNLDDLRTEIDSIDTQLHDLLMRRGELVGRIARAKFDDNNAQNTNHISVRPAREMAIVRTLLERHKGPISPVVVTRIWREIITAIAQIQSNFSVVVAAPNKSVGYWDLARDYFGTATPILLSTNATDAIGALRVNQPAQFAVLPALDRHDLTPWWPLLLEGDGSALHIVARLPVLANKKAALETLSSIVVARAENVPIEPDVHYMAVQSDNRHSAHDLTQAFKATCLTAKLLSTGQTSFGQQWWHLIEVAGQMPDSHVQHLINNSQGRFMTYRHLGGYFVSLDSLISESTLNQESPQL